MAAEEIPVVRKRNICLIVAQINHQAIVTIEQKDLRDLGGNKIELGWPLRYALRVRAPRFELDFTSLSERAGEVPVDGNPARVGHPPEATGEPEDGPSGPRSGRG